MKRLLLSTLLLATGLAFAQPANDNCTNATIIPVNQGILCTQTVNGTLTGATASGTATPTQCNGNPNDDVWFTFTATTGKHSLTIVPDTAGVTMMYALYTGDCGNLVYKNCASITTSFLNNIVAGETYKVRVYSQSASPQTVNFTACVNTAEVITTNTAITPVQLIETLTGNSPCVLVSNVTYSGGSTYGLPASIGTFSKNNTNFPIDSGILLATGPAATAAGPNNTVNSNGQGWPGDIELETLGVVTNTNDATKLEFDFVPQINHISFEYIFASEEYDGSYACTYGDVFAFILTDMETGIKTNLALVPGTNTRVSVLTIRDMQYLGDFCPSVNPQYFGNYYGAMPFAAPVNFNGMTVPLTAQSAVIPGRQYHIKLVIGNASDHIYNSAVFLKAGSFNIGDITSGYTQLTSSAGAVLCNGQGTTLSVNGSDTLVYTWKHNGQPVPGATSNTLTVTEAGNYTVNIAMPNATGCSVEHSIVLHSATAGTAPEVNDIWVYEPNSDGVHPFDFATQTAAITSMTGYGNMIVSFHLTEADAQANVNPLASPYVNVANPQDIYVRIQNPTNSCYVVTQFSIGAVDENYVTPPPTGAGTQGFVPGDTLADIEIDGDNIQWYDNPGSDATGRFTTDSVDTPLPLTTLLVDGMTYYASQTKFGRESVQRLPVTIDAAMNTENISFKNFSYRPNPVKDVLQLSNGLSIDNVDVYNIVGQKVKSVNFGNTNATLDMSSLTNGVYIVKVTSANAEKTIKIVKQ